MKRRAFLASIPIADSGLLGFCQDPDPALRIVLDPDDPSSSHGLLVDAELSRSTTFPVGFGKHGLLPEGERFRGGYSLLGQFRINAILADDRFEMTEALAASSGKSRDWLAEHLFANMSSIDFDGDGRGGEYGAAYIGLEPVDTGADQPFHFGEYRGVFRWYSYALHGTQDGDRIGKRITGGCINVGERDLERLVERLRLGARIEVIESKR